jgi:hypothetical protein
MHSILKPDHALTGDERPTCGFITDRLTFLDRIDGYYEAYACGQCKEQRYDEAFNKWVPDTLKTEAKDWHPFLASDDLW